MKRFLTLTLMFGVLCGFLAVPTFALTEGQFLPRNRPQPAFLPVPGTAPLPMQAPVEAGASKKLGPVACALIRNHVAKALVKRDGIGLVAAHRKAREIDDDTINSMVVAAEKASGAKVGALGDGTFIQAILDWLKSPQGAAFIDAIIKIILDLLAFDTVQSHHYYTLHLDQRERIYQYSPSLAA